MKRRFLSLLAVVLGAFWISSCATTQYSDLSTLDSAPSNTAAGSYLKSEPGVAKRAPSVPERPGLGTAWGENQSSHVSTSAFERGSSSPLGVAQLYYNNEAGAKAMADHSGFRWKSDGRVTSPDGSVTVSLKSGFRTLKGYSASGKEFVIGESGQKYAIVIRNNTGRRLEVVASVDGLDVMDGRTASTRKRGYVLSPKGSVTIKGFRRSTYEVAAFRFSSVSGSYANLKHGETRNVGVIGVAVFGEKTSQDVNRRFAAEPFASPPN